MNIKETKFQIVFKIDENEFSEKIVMQRSKIF